MFEQDDDVPPLDPVKVFVFVLLLGLIAFAGWRYWRDRAAVVPDAEASKDYRNLFVPRSVETPTSPPQSVVTAEAPASGIGMLKIDDDMRESKPVPAAEPLAAPQPSAQPETKPAAVAKPAPKAFRQPRLNSGAFSGLNGGTGITFSGSAMSGGDGGAAVSASTAAPDIPGMPDLSGMLPANAGEK